MFTIPSLLMHLVVILFGALVYFQIKPKKKKPEQTALLTIGKAYDLLSRQIHAADSYAEIINLQRSVEEFYHRKYHGEPDTCMRVALRKSLLISYNRKLQELKASTEKL